MAGGDKAVIHHSLVNTIAGLVNKNEMAVKKNLPGPRDIKINVSYLFCHSPFISHYHSSPVVHVVCSK